MTAGLSRERKIMKMNRKIKSKFEVKQTLATRYLVRNGILEILLGFAGIYFGLFHYLILNSLKIQAGVVTIVVLLIAVLFLSTWKKFEGKQESAPYQWKMTVMVTFSIMALIAGLLLYLSNVEKSVLPTALFIVILIHVLALAFLTKLPRFWFYTLWTIAALVASLMLRNTGSVMLGYMNLTYGALTGVVILTGGIVQLCAYIRNPSRYDVGPVADESDGWRELASKSDTSIDRPVTEADLMKVGRIIGQAKGSMFEDGSMEMFIGYLFIVEMLETVLTRTSSEWLKMYSSLMVFLLLADIIPYAIWGFLRIKYRGIIMPGFSAFIIVLGCLAWEIGKRLGIAATPSIVFLMCSLVALFMTKFWRNYVYAAWAIISYPLAIWINSAFFSDKVGVFTLDALCFSISLLILGAVAFADFYRKYVIPYYENGGRSSSSGVSQEAR